VLSAGLLVVLPGCKVAKGTDASEAKVAEFHARWNADQWKLIYDEAHMNLRSAEPEAKVAGVMTAMKKTYGEMKSTSKEGTDFNSNNGVTDINLTYRTVYEHGEGVEKFVFRLVGEDPKLLSWELMQPEVAAAKRKAEEEAREAERAAKKAEREAERAGNVADPAS
jgi:hypothetical protein